MKQLFRTFISCVGIGVLVVSCGAPGPVSAPAPSVGIATPAYKGQNVSDIVTAGNRSGDGAINRNSIDSILNKPERSARARKGLATGWGKEVKSVMGYTGFTRASSKPTGGVDVIHYNDVEGARAMGASKGWRRSSMQTAANGLVSWGVKGRWKKLATHYWKRGRIVVGEKGQKYSLIVKNLSRSRLEAVLSVDGLDVIDGKPASVRKPGYIVAPGKTLEVKGFRTSAEAVAAFKFSSVPHSYANLRHGNTRNVGVMGLAVFTEKGVDPWGRNLREIKRRGAASPFAEAPMLKARD